MPQDLVVLPQSITAGNLKVKTAGNCEIITCGHKCEVMAKDSKRKDPTPEELAEQEREGAALRKIYSSRKGENWKVLVKPLDQREGAAGTLEKLSQGSLGAAAGGISQGMINHLMAGTRRMTKQQAINIAEALDVSVSDFSPRLAKEIREFTAAGMNVQIPTDERSVAKFTAEMREYRKRAFDQLLALPDHRIEEWLQYADYLRTKDPPPEQQGGRSGEA